CSRRPVGDVAERIERNSHVAHRATATEERLTFCFRKSRLRCSVASVTEPAIPAKRISTRATGVVGIAVLCSRVLGLLREVIFAALFGASRNMDAFLTAFRAPNMLRDLFAEGALSTAFVTTFSRRIATEGDDSAWRLASKVATLTVVFMSGLTVLGIIGAPVL